MQTLLVTVVDVSDGPAANNYVPTGPDLKNLFLPVLEVIRAILVNTENIGVRWPCRNILRICLVVPLIVR